jgi:hypothetical protein
MEKGKEIQFALSDKTGALMMINKKERQILREILSMTMNSKGGKGYIARKFGPEAVEIAENLLEALEG